MTEDFIEPLEGLDIETNFNVDDEFRPEPLIPIGTYHAAVTNVTFDSAQQAIVWSFVLHDNGGTMSDGITNVDGAVAQYRNWLPRPGDENELTSNGRNTKRQSKINMLKQFSKVLDIDMSTPEKIITALTEQQWVGIEVDIAVSTREWDGKFFNDVKKVMRSTM